MLGSILSFIGGKIGGLLGGGILSTIARYSAKTIGTYFDKKLTHTTEDIYQATNIKDSFHILKPSYGDPIALIFGRVRVEGKIIWADKIKIKRDTDIRSRYLNAENTTIKKHVTNFEYYFSCAILLCEGYVTEISRIFYKDEEIDISNYDIRLYPGSEDQLPDPLIASVEKDKACGYRGLSYIVFEELPLADFDNIIPKFSFEVVRKSTTKQSTIVEDMVESIIMIPGSGEYIYDTSIQTKTDYTIANTTNAESRKSDSNFPNTIFSYSTLSKTFNTIFSCITSPKQAFVQCAKNIIKSSWTFNPVPENSHTPTLKSNEKTINSNNHFNIADSIHSLNQLQTTCDNVKWISPVTCWFGDNIDARYCKIRPAIEFNDRNIKYSEDWKVGNYNRNNAYEITKEDITDTYRGNPRYGGTVNDASIIRYLKELKRRGLKIMFYPMIFLDCPGKPWRGKITTEPNYIKDFFQKSEGYNNFILHYAHLVKDHVDAFVIGSELIGLTKVRDKSSFPAVDELIKLAKQVKQIMGSTLITYAADWSEYHHTEDGWFNLDSLWASPDIDFIGIDAYFPITDTKSSHITLKEINQGFQSGEGYDYYIDHATNTKHKLTPKYAWKNIKYWWENYHINPDDTTTSWKPRSKKIWFTEFGFPSIDKATNQPNIFFDPKSIDGGSPKYSTSSTDFLIQRKAIRAFIEFWSKEEYIEEMFLWTWDARPYPAWPYMKIWRDGYLWAKGHWVNNKFGLGNLASILLEISKRVGINTEQIDVTSVDELIAGFILKHRITAKSAINILRSSYFFDISATNESKIVFRKRSEQIITTINSSRCIRFGDNNHIKEIEIATDSILGKLDLYFIDQHRFYRKGYIHINNEQGSHISNATLHIPIVMNMLEAESIGRKILNNAAIEDKIVKFTLDILSQFELKAGDFICLLHDKKYYLRIIQIEITKNKANITSVADSKEIYHNQNNVETNIDSILQQTSYTRMAVLDLPLKLHDQPYLAIYLMRQISSVALHMEINKKWYYINDIESGSVIGELIEFKESDHANIFIRDEKSKIIIYAKNMEEYSSDHYIIIGSELISFKRSIRLKENIYLISNLIRGCKGTEKSINRHIKGEIFVMAEIGVNIISMSKNAAGEILKFKSRNIEQIVHYKNKAHTSPAPYQIEGKCIDRENNNDYWDVQVENNRLIYSS